MSKVLQRVRNGEIVDVAYENPTKADHDISILELALFVVSNGLDDFVGACMAGQPTTQQLNKARALLPPYCKNAFKKK